jgi:hypothetical protein
MAENVETVIVGAGDAGLIFGAIRDSEHIASMTTGGSP